jgi:hypothetical protein
MTDGTNGKSHINWVGILFSVVLFAITVDIGFTAWLSTRWIETETTQDRVLATLDAHQRDINDIKSEHGEMHKQIVNVDDGDRWYKSLQLEYAQRVEDNLRYLQLQINELKICYGSRNKYETSHQK